MPYAICPANRHPNPTKSTPDDTPIPFNRKMHGHIRLQFWPVWHTTAPVTKPSYVDEANRGKLEMYRMWCRKREVRIENTE